MNDNLFSDHQMNDVYERMQENDEKEILIENEVGMMELNQQNEVSFDQRMRLSDIQY